MQLSDDWVARQWSTRQRSLHTQESSQLGPDPYMYVAVELLGTIYGTHVKPDSSHYVNDRQAQPEER